MKFNCYYLGKKLKNEKTWFPKAFAYYTVFKTILLKLCYINKCFSQNVITLHEIYLSTLLVK